MGVLAAVFSAAGVLWALTASAGAADGVDCGSGIRRRRFERAEADQNVYPGVNTITVPTGFNAERGGYAVSVLVTLTYHAGPLELFAECTSQ
jgi:hypothetical protein